MAAKSPKASSKKAATKNAFAVEGYEVFAPESSGNAFRTALLTAIITKSVTATVDFAKQFVTPPDVGQSGFTPEILEVINVLNTEGQWDGYVPAAHKMFGALVREMTKSPEKPDGIDISSYLTNRSTNKRVYPVGAIVTQVRQDTYGHGLAVNESALVIGNNYRWLNVSGTRAGTELPANLPAANDLRPATLDEMKAFFKAIPVDKLWSEIQAFKDHWADLYGDLTKV